VERYRSAKITYRLPPDEHQEAVQTNKVLWLAAILAIAVVVGCSPPRSAPTGPHQPAGQLAGRMEDWVKAICDGGAARPLSSGPDRRHLAGAANPMKCSGTMQTASDGGTEPVSILIGTYASRYVMELDLGGLGAYAKGANGTQYVVFASVPTAPVTLVAESTLLQPLEAYGFEIFLSPNPSVEPPPPAPEPAPPEATPSETPTRTSASEPSATPDAAPPRWDGPWLRDYQEGEKDCDDAGLNYWVVQPGGSPDLYALKKGCFPKKWVNQLNDHCHSLHLPDGKCAVWDQDSIMSVNDKRGDLLIVGLVKACLDRAGIDDFHEGPLHDDCIAKPKSSSKSSATPSSATPSPTRRRPG
jgi:hypothetical protein